MKSYVIELSDELSFVYQDIANLNKMQVEKCLSIILERVIRTMINQSWTDKSAEKSKENNRNRYDIP